MEIIKDHFLQQADISEKDWNTFSSKLILRKFPKNSVILRQGEVEKYLSFIESGIVRLNFVDENKDFTFGFEFPNNFISVYDSFLTKTPASYQMCTITETKLWSIKYEDLQYAYDNTTIGDRLGRLASEGLFLIFFTRLRSVLSESAEERYLNLLKNNKDYFKKIPLKYIASYIGITPEALSRIRQRIS